ncbi:MAG: MotA/TolQ/ExbB proton channel family protein [Candidatus Zixiibacteriota bacterium]|nr:MAG: MotA/TolQ/ExbB proton channel family protein [candidate division Zixibacteria bacterium]
MDSPLLLGLFSGSIWQIIANTSAFGKFILIVLATMSFVSWAIIFRKWRLFKALSRENDTFSRDFRRCRKVGDLAGKAKTFKMSPFSAIYRAGMEELMQLKGQKNEAGGLRESVVELNGDDFEIVEMTMERASTEAFVRLEKQVIFLATTGSAAPFIGLLGTVVGIMDSFWAIGERGSASLAVVAPGIAEALVATIFGLGAAIPAVVAYNWSNNNIKRMNDRAYAFILGFLAKARKEEA